MISKKPSIALIGPGAIGTTIAAMLHETGNTPTLCGRSAYTNLTLNFDNHRIVIPETVITNPALITHTFDLVFVAVKSTQIANIASWLSALCNQQTTVCILQNGVEQKTLFSPYLSEHQIVPSVIWFPAQRESATSVLLRGKPRLTLPDTPLSQQIMNVFSQTQCIVDIATDFTSIAWRKLLQNAVAGLMVLTGCRAGMFSRNDIAKLSQSYLQECLSVARAEGAILPDEVIQEIIHSFQTAPSDLGTSILADRQARRALEWDIRNGIIQRYGQIHQIPTPISNVIVPLLAAASDDSVNSNKI